MNGVVMLLMLLMALVLLMLFTVRMALLMLMLCRSEGNWGEYGLSKVAVNCYTIELGRRYRATQESII